MAWGVEVVGCFFCKKVKSASTLVVIAAHKEYGTFVRACAECRVFHAAELLAMQHDYPRASDGIDEVVH